LHISTKGRYALRAMVELALHAGKPITRRKIAERHGISPHYMAHLFRRLRQAQLVQAVRGPGGGYELGRDAATIRVAEVLQAVEGPLSVSECALPGAESACPRAASCPVHPLWRHLTTVITTILDSTTLEDLCHAQGELAVPAGGLIDRTTSKGADG
jgi:Rrf2 family iron-sulfur cluster assembly transcriptional regulator